MKFFVAGLSKSGKSTLCLNFVENRTDIEYVSISNILNHNGGIIPVRTISDALFNQKIATEAFTKSLTSRKNFIVDGHALIETSEGPVSVPDYFFEVLQPDVLVYIQADNKEITFRRTQLGIVDTQTELLALMALEIALCERISSRLGFEFIILNAPTAQKFNDTLEQRLR